MGKGTRGFFSRVNGFNVFKHSEKYSPTICRKFCVLVWREGYEIVGLFENKYILLFGYYRPNMRSEGELKFWGVLIECPRFLCPVSFESEKELNMLKVL